MSTPRNEQPPKVGLWKTSVRASTRFLLRRIGFHPERIEGEVSAGRDRWSALLEAVRKLLGRVDVQPKHTFDAARRTAMAENDWSDQDFEDNANALRALYTKRVRAFGAIAVASIIYGLFVLFRTGAWLSFVAILVWATFIVLLALQAAFRRWQIETRCLGTINEWLLQR